MNDATGTIAAAAVLHDASRALAQWRLVRGASQRTRRRMARAAAVLVAAAGLVAAASLAHPARAATPTFTQFPFGLTNVGNNSTPAFADLDGDGDLDAFIGNLAGNTIYFENTGSSAAPAFAAAAANPFGLADVGSVSAPTFADLDGDGDLDAFIGNNAGDTIHFENTGSSGAPAFAAAAAANPFGLAAVGSDSAPAFADLDGDGDLDAFIGNKAGTTIYFENTGSSAAPAFAAAATNPFGLAAVGFRSSPTFADLDGDGDLDAFIGEFYGTTIYFENTGSSAGPAFSAAANPFGLPDVGFDSAPAFADLDGDGDLDAFIGNSAGTTIYFANTGSSAAPAFATSAANPFGLAAVGSYSAPAFVDLDGDGDLDAFIGNQAGTTIYFENTGSSAAPAFAAAATNPFGLADVGNGSAPAFADLDGDGDLDAFIGERFGDIIYFENTGSSAAPAFAAAATNPFGLADVGNSSAPAFADLDGDGDLDAFIGDRAGPIFFFANTGSSAAPAFAAAANPFGLADVGYNSAPAFADLDGDGDLDAFIGNGAGTTIYFEGTPTETPRCTGDCDGNGVVTVDELVRGVNIALGTASLAECPAFDTHADGAVRVDELVQGVNNALTGCAR